MNKQQQKEVGEFSDSSTLINVVVHCLQLWSSGLISNVFNAIKKINILKGEDLVSRMIWPSNSNALNAPKHVNISFH